jgi:hypothetical protein
MNLPAKNIFVEDPTKGRGEINAEGGLLEFGRSSREAIE